MLVFILQNILKEFLIISVGFPHSECIPLHGGRYRQCFVRDCGGVSSRRSADATPLFDAGQFRAKVGKVLGYSMNETPSYSTRSRLKKSIAESNINMATKIRKMS